MYLPKKEQYNQYHIVDIEANGLHDADTIWCLVDQNLATQEVRRFVGHAEIRGWAASLPDDAVIVGHNAISYDLPTLNRILQLGLDLDRCVDTLVLSYLYHPRLPRPEGLSGKKGPHSLEAWGLRFKFPKGDFHEFHQFSQEMLDYCVQDVRLTRRVFLALVERMRARRFSEQSCQIEHRIRSIIDQQQINGFYFDYDEALKLRQRIDDELSALAGPVHKLFPPTLEPVKAYQYRLKKDGTPTASYQTHVEKYPKIVHSLDGTYTVFDWKPFNIGSPAQRLEKLKSLGWKPTRLSKSKKNFAVDEDAVKEFAEESKSPEVAMIATWLSLAGRSSMIGTWLKAYNHETHSIHGRVFTCGAMSRRMSHNNPNTANIPGNEARYGHEVRSLWTIRYPRERRLVGVDAKSIQMRCFANTLPDPSAGRRYYDEEFCPDPHQENADIIGIKRKPAKNVFYANLFGAYPPKLATTAGFTGSKRDLDERGVWVQEQMYLVTPGLKQATEEAKAEFRRNGGFLVCPDGGFVRCKDESSALNYKIQPAEACVMKQGSIFLADIIKTRGWDVLKCGDIHDEWQFDVELLLAEELGKTAADCIRMAGEELNFRVPLAGDYKIGLTWADTH